MEQFLSNLAIYILSTVYRLFVITKIWALTVVPLGAPTIGLKGAFMVGLLITAFTLGAFKNEDSDVSYSTKAVSHALGISVAWLLAWMLS